MTTAVQLAQSVAPGVSLGFKNRIINGDMRIDQRNAGASVTPTTNGYTLDRWTVNVSASSKFSVQQSSTAPAGFKNSILITSLASTSVGSTDYYFFRQVIEGYNIADLGWGAAGASTVTLSFWVRSSLTGTFGGAIRSGDYNYCYPFSYTISAANTWEQKTVTIVGPTTGVFSSTNSNGFEVCYSLGMGTTYSGTAGSWAASNYASATGATSVVGTNGATFYITGVQLEVGTAATSFEYRDYGRELIMCQRYYEKSYDIGTVPGTATRTGMMFFVTEIANSTREIPIRFTVEKRAAPTVVSYSANLGNINTMDTSSTYIQAAIIEFTSTKGTNIYCATSGYWAMLHYTASAEL